MKGTGADPLRGRVDVVNRLMFEDDDMSVDIHRAAGR